jgi:hypothetical protein
MSLTNREVLAAIKHLIGEQTDSVDAIWPSL